MISYVLKKKYRILLHSIISCPYEFNISRGFGYWLLFEYTINEMDANKISNRYVCSLKVIRILDKEVFKSLFHKTSMQCFYSECRPSAQHRIHGYASTTQCLKYIERILQPFRLVLFQRSINFWKPNSCLQSIESFSYLFFFFKFFFTSHRCDIGTIGIYHKQRFVTILIFFCVICCL